MNPGSGDFARDVYALFGLPIDNLTIEATKRLLREKIEQDGVTVWSTVNVNWVVQSLKDKQFYNAILDSDIVTLDGKPLLWLTRLLGYPMRETVPGSTLIQELLEEKTDKPVTIFLFGGEEGAAELAMERINRQQGGLKAVGALNPGFGTVEEMSTNAIITAINRTKPDILLVALGAKKGTQWIEYNRHRLDAKIVSHLGATVNFLAGTVMRAPKFFRTTGLEWVWRILQEPKLFLRYAGDGLVMLKLLTGRVFLWKQYRGLHKWFIQRPVDDHIIRQDHSDTTVFVFGQNLQAPAGASIRWMLADAVQTGKNITLDFARAEYVDGGFLALLLLLHRQLEKSGNRLTCTNVSGRLVKLFRLFSIPEEMLDTRI